MVECERCGDEVSRLFEHRTRTETMTHRRTEHVCASCHPTLPAELERRQTRERAVTDGGTRVSSCPTCSGTTVDDSGVLRCVECGWTGV
ncbi:hypothetical protein JMJ58_18975 [Haloterrigena salifodinae]|uniref:Uncharacterized protein n=1 Tax=Haloterrigena salifodinae TaxID=2675099 RepID=A0A8T8E018_9EURY|nr:hypothetical protein [Haloterrigena salifodinae]QRV14967.1 hypothetical protein JMJ58_18975 [Haloterrigena salifodinae]